MPLRLWAKRPNKAPCVWPTELIVQILLNKVVKLLKGSVIHGEQSGKYGNWVAAMSGDTPIVRVEDLSGQKR